MSLKENIKNKFGKLKLSKDVKTLQRVKTFHNFNTAKSVGIIFDGTNPSDYDAARAFAKFLTEKKIRVFGLGFVETKEVSNFYSYYTGFNFFTIKDTNWQGIPSNHNVNDFINEKIDILVDLHLTESFQLDYICAMSIAEFKIGALTTKNKYYDFMIDVSSNPNPDFLCDQIKHYLSIINNSTK